MPLCPLQKLISARNSCPPTSNFLPSPLYIFAEWYLTRSSLQLWSGESTIPNIMLLHLESPIYGFREVVKTVTDWPVYLVPVLLVPASGTRNWSVSHPLKTVVRSTSPNPANMFLNKKHTNLRGRQNTVPLKFDPKPSQAAFSAVFFELRLWRSEVANDVRPVWL